MKHPQRQKVPNPSFTFLTGSENRELRLENEYAVYAERRKRARQVALDSGLDPDRQKRSEPDRIE